MRNPSPTLFDFIVIDWNAFITVVNIKVLYHRSRDCFRTFVDLSLSKPTTVRYTAHYDLHIQLNRCARFYIFAYKCYLQLRVPKLHAMCHLFAITERTSRTQSHVVSAIWLKLVKRNRSECGRLFGHSHGKLHVTTSGGGAAAVRKRYDTTKYSGDSHTFFARKMSLYDARHQTDLTKT